MEWMTSGLKVLPKQVEFSNMLECYDDYEAMKKYDSHMKERLSKPVLEQWTMINIRINPFNKNNRFKVNVHPEYPHFRPFVTRFANRERLAIDKINERMDLTRKQMGRPQLLKKFEQVKTDAMINEFISRHGSGGNILPAGGNGGVYADALRGGQHALYPEMMLIADKLNRNSESIEERKRVIGREIMKGKSSPLFELFDKVTTVGDTALLKKALIYGGTLDEQFEIARQHILDDMNTDF